MLTWKSILTLPARLFYAQKFCQLSSLPANHLCHSFCLLNQLVKFSHQSLVKILKKVFTCPSLCFLSTLTCIDHHGFVSTWDHKLQGLGPDCVKLCVPTIDPTSIAGRHCVDCIPVARSCAPWYHTFLDKDGYLNQHHPMFGFYSIPVIILDQSQFPR